MYIDIDVIAIYGEGQTYNISSLYSHVPCRLPHIDREFCLSLHRGLNLHAAQLVSAWLSVGPEHNGFGFLWPPNKSNLVGLS